MIASVIGTTAALIYITGTLLNPFFIVFIIVIVDVMIVKISFINVARESGVNETYDIE